MFTVCCRICLNQINFNQMLSLFQTYKGFVIRDALFDLFNIQILPTEMVSTICKECVGKVCTVRHIRDEFIKQDERYREMLASSPAKDDSDEEQLPEQKPDIRPDPSPTVESTTGEDKLATVEDTDSTVKHGTESARMTDCDSDSNTLVLYMEQSNDKDDHDAQNSEYELLVVSESSKESPKQREEYDEFHIVDLTIGDSDNTDTIYCKNSHEAKHRPTDKNAATETILKEVKYEHMYLCEQCDTYLETRNAYTSHDCPGKRTTEEQTEQNVVSTLTTNKQHNRSTNKLPSLHCAHCPVAFQTNAQLMRHTKQSHPDRYEVHRCEACSARFASQHALDRHSQFRHQGSYQCRFCSKQLLSAYALKSHENTHTKQQTFACPQCDRMFAQYTSMRRHMTLHSDVKAYECEFCQQRFRQRTVMLAHRRRHTGEKPYACDVCDRKFRDHSTLAKHKRLHTQQAKPDLRKVKQESTV